MLDPMGGIVENYQPAIVAQLDRALRHPFAQSGIYFPPQHHGRDVHYISLFSRELHGEDGKEIPIGKMP